MTTSLIAFELMIGMGVASAQNIEEGPPPILFTIATVFDGFNPELIEGANVMVEGNVITLV